MKQEPFDQRNRADWQRLQDTLDALEEAGNRPARLTPEAQQQIAELPGRYRNSCHQLALARSRAYSPRLLAELGALVGRGHRALYRNRPPLWPAIATFIAGGFPQQVRAEWRAVLAAALLFIGPLLAMLVAVQLFPQSVYTVIEPWQVGAMEAMYEPDASRRIGESRDSGSDIRMFGYYLRNNTSIGFQTFAGGLLFGVGSLFFLLYNGLLLGAVAGHMTQLGYIETFWGFVAGHSAPELTAIVLSGAAGLKLGWALLAPGRRTRLRALRDEATVAVRIVYGAALLFLLAAFIEAFWSSMAFIPAVTKYAVGGLGWLLLLTYLLGAGRRHAL